MSETNYLPYSAPDDALAVTIYHAGDVFDFDAVDANGVTIGARYGFRTGSLARSAAVAEYGARVAVIVSAPGCRCIGCEVNA